MLTNPLPDFPEKTRGTYRVKGDEETSESEKLQLAKKKIWEVAKDYRVTILLDSKMRGGGWVLIWWPANEPRHEETDQFIN